MNKKYISPALTHYDEPIGNNFCYESPKQKIDFLSRLFPSPMFYYRVGKSLAWLAYKARLNQNDGYTWVKASKGSFRAMEKTGCHITIEGLNHVIDADGPCVFVANHMSTLETFLLPSIIYPRKPVTFIIKRSLMSIPFFGRTLVSREPIIIDRKSARQDLKHIFEEGVKRLCLGISIIVFPQHTRDVNFDIEKFNSIGVKLAKKAQVPVVPLALQTNAWGQGKLIKDIGYIKPEIPIHFKFGKAVQISGTGKNEHKYICNFIYSALEKWKNIV